jgi:hypothetical protein
MLFDEKRETTVFPGVNFRQVYAILTEQGLEIRTGIYVTGYARITVPSQ